MLIEAIQKSTVVISMLPANLHFGIAQKCLALNSHLLTASYISEDIKLLDMEAKNKKLSILMELGLDPGIDHISTMDTIETIKKNGGTIKSYKSYTGGVVAPESDNNPWGYKIAWNPKNIVTAGKDGARFLKNNKHKFIPYHNLFDRLDEIHIPEIGFYEGYANRDSLKYRPLYGLDGVETILRGTLRKKGFCQAWNALVRLGITSESFWLENMKGISFREFTNAFLRYHETETVETKFSKFAALPKDSEAYKAIEWLGLFDKNKLIEINEGYPATILQQLLEEKWELAPEDRDMIVMHHEFIYQIENKIITKKLSLNIKGNNSRETSMAKTVGIPLAIAIEMLAKKMPLPYGVNAPITPEVYQYMAKELKNYGIDFREV